jgi:cystathionine gamma-synthase
MDFETKALHGHRDNALLHGVVAPPIQLSTTYLREGDGTYPSTFSYTRRSNPNREALEETLAALEGGVACAAFASGTAATMAVFQALGTGDHVLVPKDAYYGTREMLREIFPRWGLAATFVDMTDLAAITASVTPKSKLLWLETPSNPMMKVTDLAAAVGIARRVGALTVVDNTVATPVLQRPFTFGVDLVVHSTTKYLNGHSDVLGGAVVAREATETLRRLRTIQVHGGAVPSAFDCWLALRGVRTVAQRVREQSRNAQRIAEWLAEQPAVTAVHYAGLKTHPQHALAAKQMTQFGGLLSFQVRGGAAGAMAVAAGVALIRRATSLGGVETTLEHRASMEGPDTTTPQDLLRMSVGLESPEDLISDLERALARA